VAALALLLLLLTAASLLVTPALAPVITRAHEK
jgi:hypothetical protein